MPEIEDLMIEVQNEVEEDIVAYFEEYDASLIDQLVEKGMGLVTFPEAEGKAFVDTFYDAMWEIAAGDISPEDLVKIKAMIGD